ncbi:hypothetical protein GCK72_000644 [Caenorhabditis remanei]|uniref:Uncharacterized protein n=1 Tax=Caenorhabditis remanei TaxID=31234 RepID=A0A6A5HNN0_CAERE|nr:hypothetical protein GCK72_000644 [Caenorhabditis remanei]KAF1768831.1 hypothetical protein GCK72_000644 [Caenorhabditis remanei]
MEMNPEDGNLDITILSSWATSKPSEGDTAAHAISTETPSLKKSVPKIVVGSGDAPKDSADGCGEMGLYRDIEFLLLNVPSRNHNTPDPVLSKALRESGLTRGFEFAAHNKLPFRGGKSMFRFRLFDERDAKKLVELIGGAESWHKCSGLSRLFWRKTSVSKIGYAFIWNFMYGFDKSISRPQYMKDINKEGIRNLLKQRKDLGPQLLWKVKETMHLSMKVQIENMLSGNCQSDQKETDTSHG